MLRRRYMLFVAILLLSSIAVQAQNAVIRWDTIASDTVLGSAGKPGGVASIYLAYVHLAIYDAVANTNHRFEPYGPRFAVPAGASLNAAVAAAAHRALIGLLPTLFITPAQQGLIPGVQASLDAAFAADLATIPAGAAKTNGVTAGETAALQILLLRANDGREDPAVVFTPGAPAAGVWQPVPIGPVTPPPFAPWVGQMAPFTMTSASQFLPKRGPLALSSREWARNYNRTRLLGAKTGSLRTPEQTDIGLFWSDNPSAQYVRALRRLAVDQHLSAARSARMLAMVLTGQADAFIGCMNAKYHFAFWRPFTAIRNGDIDGNPDTPVDPDWVPLDPTPPHPEYPAAHGCVTAATAAVLRSFFHRDRINNFTFDSLVPGVVQPVRTFHRFRDLVLEIRRARVYGGMHYRDSVIQGEALGEAVARQLVREHFRIRREERDED